MAIAGVESVAEGGGWLCGSAEGQHALSPGLTGQTVRGLSRVCRPLRGHADGGAKEIFARFRAHADIKAQPN
jgi:hypothetical protein